MGRFTSGACLPQRAAHRSGEYARSTGLVPALVSRAAPDRTVARMMRTLSIDASCTRANFAERRGWDRMHGSAMLGRDPVDEAR